MTVTPITLPHTTYTEATYDILVDQLAKLSQGVSQRGIMSEWV